MTQVDERAALAPRTILEHAELLHFTHPDGPLPDGGRPYPDAERHAGLPQTGRRTAASDKALVDLVTSVYRAEPAAARARFALAEALRPVGVASRGGGPLIEAVASFDPRWRHRVGRHLACTGTERSQVLVGLILLGGVAGPDDALPVRLLGLLGRHFGEPAIRVLRQIPAADDLIWLAERSDPLRHSHAVAALCALADPATFGWLLREGVRSGEPSVQHARSVAETVDLPDLLNADVPMGRRPSSTQGDGKAPFLHLSDAEVVEQAGWLLATMMGREAGNAELRRYAGAGSALAGFTRGAGRMRPGLDRYAMVVSVLADLHAGQAATLPLPEGELSAMRAALARLLDEPAWAAVRADAERSADPATRHRAQWARATRTACRLTPPAAESDGQAPPDGAPADGGRSSFAIRVAVGDPGRRGGVETRIFIDRRPVVGEAFDKGPSEQPEYLLGPEHRLRAGDEPHEVRLAEAECTEGCCGALYVTVERQGAEVVWRDWRNPDRTGVDLPSFRFAAHEYDAEVARAEGDHSWEWPDRTVARLVRARLRQEPDLLGRWDCHPGWLSAGPHGSGQVHVSYFHPRRPSLADEPWLQFVAVLDVPPGEPESVADEVVRQLADTDPRRPERLSGGSAGAVEALGFDWPASRRPDGGARVG
ncbi:hypothetical protein [Catellatospora citrea]|uniref:Uncharacterized protein n=1 Tax=Catellatospora citrea TaxID=53366 RepID=A0A8J3K832_9ACTN|nr:hypothetical protein [Catellatospora citrea]RKE06820.1 hypothetical protein C8E86_1642 [Catellatospora citrea]GIF94966.1 hypothetical protein Cci01nite_00600 [Catellatospora citrea]